MDQRVILRDWIEVVGMRQKQFPSLFFVIYTAAGMAQTGGIAGTGLYVAPSTTAFANVGKVAAQIEIESGVASATKVVTYDTQVFAALALYPGSVAQLKGWYRVLAPTEAAESESTALGLAPISGGDISSLIQLSVPQYAIQGQALKVENDALISAFAGVHGENNLTISSYLTPKAVPGPADDKTCGAIGAIASFAQMWSCVDYAASQLNGDRRKYQNGFVNPLSLPHPLPACPPGPVTDECKKAIQREIDKITGKLEDYQKGRDSYLAADKAQSLFSRLLIAERLLDEFTETPVGAKAPPAKIRVIDLRLDGTGFDSTTRQILFWKTTTFSANAMAHYYVFELTGGYPSFGLKLEKSGLVAVAKSRVNEKDWQRQDLAGEQIVPQKPK